MMKNTFSRLFLALFFSLGLSYFACEGPDQPVYGPDHPDPNPTGFQPARVDSISPTTGYLKDIVSIYGSGFNLFPAYNLVIFGTKLAEVVSATDNLLKVRAPNLADMAVPVRIAVKGSEFWSNETEFAFLPTLETIDEEIVWPNGIAVDDDGNVFVGAAQDGIIFRITPTGEKSEFAQAPVNGSIHFGPNHFLYVCEKAENKIVRISPDGSTIEDVVSIKGPVDFTWDADHNLYIVSDAVGVFKLVGSDTVRLADVASGKNCRVFGDHLFVNDIWNNTILSWPITATGLGDAEVVLETDSPSTLEFDANGLLYFCKAWETSLFVINAEGAEEVLYEGELMTPMRYTAFKNKTMYIVFPGWQDVGGVIKAYIGVQQAPDYGIQ
jgi:hypothetical protein